MEIVKWLSFKLVCRTKVSKDERYFIFSVKMVEPKVKGVLQTNPDLVKEYHRFLLCKLIKWI